MTKTDDFEMREPGPDQRDNVVNTSFHPDTFREFERYRVENELNTSEALRRLVRDGLDNQQPTWRPIPTLTLFLGFGFIMLAAEPPGDYRFYVATGAVLIVLTAVYAAAQSIWGNW